MNQFGKIKIPQNFDFQHWCARWDKMQEKYLVKRNERFNVISQLINSTQDKVEYILDIGCGTGSLMLNMLESFPKTKVIGIDFDPTILILAKGRLDKYKERSKIVFADIRDNSWVELIENPLNAIVSATALHWLNPKQLKLFYKQIIGLLRSNGIFLNADHVSSAYPLIQKTWEENRDKMRKEEYDNFADDWNSFWKAFGKALSGNIDEINKRVIGGWEGGIEDGLPLQWHFEKLKDCGFSYVDCFWRCDCDAIYGGILSNKKKAV